MNLDTELDRITAPAPCATKPRMLSRAEIEALQSAGQITDPANIPEFHYRRRISNPTAARGGSSYGRSFSACRRAL